MNSSLLEEAIVDAQKLRELAEQTAKNKIVEAVMPQIREMINKRILGESLEARHEAEDSKADIEEYDLHEEDADDSVEESLAEALAKLVSERQKSKEETNENEKNKEEAKKIKNIEETVYNLKLALSEGFVRNNSDSKKIANKIVKCTESAFDLVHHLSLNENSTNKGLNRRLENSIKELKDMARKNRDIFDFLFEDNSSRSLNEATLTIDFDEEEKEALGDSYEELERILSNIAIEFPGAGGDEDEEGGDEEEDLDLDLDAEASDEEEGDEEEGDEEEGDEEEGDENLELSAHYRARESARNQMEMQHEEDQLQNEMFESLVRRFTRNGRRIRENAAAEKADHFGGAKVLGDVILDLDEEDLINVLADELGSYQGVSTPKMRAESRRRTADRRTASLQESVNQARSEANNYRTKAMELQQQLTEMNLFNAKLLYANKLMQNKDLTMKQQRAIVEALDNAKTIREAKLLFESLTESLNRKPQTTKNLKEGMVRPVGTASKPIRSAAPANASGVDSDRWAILAGINK